ncbi:hypothetical protein HRR83_007596 [Exophiala dermatitidis]|uniref:Uncharacterized protein n=2 Tax=Exophiala dermatitidis TaxID=5970 RepID=H6BLF9_EXODN|nr:uncharacterized protein HMPREF1120_01059 [Exophiala dermatitidis NIH/UT8656]KAJ4510013.1 hypothetical protein HRR74_007165 [Exophiala dermatitidis]EHY52852.1 hypothetical protein HMPREF1120_01059 [Exophiala dermatitidis NIH/UT8656]KAJ4521734.1 hypothetical protein HRR73_002932 [Exophiala dermatitidis]KAJ4539425.1 hypothetical protein HRR77_006312 [Exophiala dermatitidis]KAJ4548494.1 hypothetical protein HRR76_001090 [Exophiala dermatitidis]
MPRHAQMPDMAQIQRRDSFNDTDYESCPVGGRWAKCEDVNYPTFIGCCSSNPCSGQMCPAENLFPMGFGAVTSPAPDYPNHSCPYGGLWYTCAANTIPFQGCCVSNPCNGQGCPSADLRPAALHTVVVAGTSTFTVPSSVSTPAPTSTSSSTTTAWTTSTFTPAQSSHKTNTAAIAGGASAAGVVVLAVIVIVFYCCLRRRKAKAAANSQPAQSQELKNYYSPATNVSTPLPNYTKSAAHDPSSPTPTYTSGGTPRFQEAEPQEIMGLGLSTEEFHRRSKSRTPAQSLGSPIELPSQRPSGMAPELEADSPLLDSRSRQTNERKSTLHNSTGYSDFGTDGS